MLIDFRERGREGEEVGEKHQYERETWVVPALTGARAPQPGTEPTT